MATLARRIAGARHEAGLMQEELAERVGVTQSAVQQWESGRTRPRVHTLRKVADALGKPVSYFLEDNDDQPPCADTSPKTIRLTIDGKTYEGTPEQIADLSARLTPKDANTEPGVAALLADEALCRSLGITEADRAVLLAIRANGLIRTAQQAIVVLQALRID